MFAIYVSGNFPFEDYEKLADFLVASEVLVPAFIPAEVGLLSLDAVTYASHVDKLQTVFVPDRNIVSRLVKVVRDGGVGKRDVPTQVALTTMAVTQTANFLIDPSTNSATAKAIPQPTGSFRCFVSPITPMRGSGSIWRLVDAIISCRPDRHLRSSLST